MRPITLTMEAFGSYGKKTFIDFTEPNQNLFLITGDTGAGKSTIFDAIAFALYGEASSVSNKKDGVELQSQFVDYGIVPYVELCFSEIVGGETLNYSVRRVPRHVRALKRGSGIKDEKEKVSLILPDGREFSQNKKETDSKLEEIVGLTKNQFMQIAMIAQGEFMELLRADSNKKKEIFRKLFNTEQYQKIVDELACRRKEKLSEITQIRTVCQTEVSHVEVPETWEHSQELMVLKKSICSSDKLNVAEMEEFLAGLKLLCETIYEKGQQARREDDLAKKVRDEKRDAHNQAKTLWTSFLQMEKAQKDLTACEEASEEMKQTAQLIETINGAYEIKAEYQRYRDTAKTAQDTEEKLRKQRENLPTLLLAYQRAETAEIAAHREQEEELERFTKLSERVNKARDLFGKLQLAERDVSEKKATLALGEKKTAETTVALAALEEQETAWKKDAEDLKDAPTLLLHWERKQEEAQGIANDLAVAKELQGAVQTQRKTLEQLQQIYHFARQNYQEKNGDYLRKQADFLDAQAGFLAKEKLRPGEPCPVCGSLEHPQPCVLSVEHGDLTRDMIDALATEVATLQERLTAASEGAGSAAKLLEEKEKTLASSLEKVRERLSKAFMDLPNVPSLQQMEELLLAWQKTVLEERKVLREKATALLSLQNKLIDTESKKQELLADRETAVQQMGQWKVALAASEATLENLKTQKDFRNEEEAAATLTAAAEKKQAKDSAYNSAHSAALAAKTAKENAETLITNYEQEFPKQKEELALRKATYEQILSQKQIEEQRWQEVVQLHSRSDGILLQEKLNSYKERKAAAEASFYTAKQTIGNQTKPNLEQLAMEEIAAEECLVQSTEKLNQLIDLYRRNERAYKALAPKMEERSQITREFSRIDGLYNRLAGKVSGAKMDIETFVQRYYLQRILYAANVRFSAMSAGQFELRMTGEERAGEGKNRGLDLMVYSTVTGKEREVRTLSGGESFMAALSLALGMADQIQESTSAINLDIMFIDEGFGSLDEHSRNQAVRVLKEMAGGSKLIGIISHVTELKQEIENQLIVQKDDNGSRVKWQIS